MAAQGYLQTFPVGQAMTASPVEADVVSLDGHVG